MVKAAAASVPEPKSWPTVPPVAMNPKTRRPWSLEKWSDTNPQKIETLKSTKQPMTRTNREAVRTLGVNEGV